MNHPGKIIFTKNRPISHKGILLLKQYDKAIVFAMLRSFSLWYLIHLGSVKVKETSSNTFRLNLAFITELGNSWSTLRGCTLTCMCAAFGGGWVGVGGRCV